MTFGSGSGIIETEREKENSTQQTKNRKEKMKVYREKGIVINLEEVIYISYCGDRRSKFAVEFTLKGGNRVWSQKYETEEECQQILKMCYDTMAEPERA